MRLVVSHEVWVTNGHYHLSAQIEIYESILIRSINGPSYTVVDGDNTYGCFFVGHSNAVVDGFTITRGYSNVGGGLTLDHGGTVINCVISNNTAFYGSGIIGGGVYCNMGGNVENCIITENSAYWGGGVECHFGTLPTSSDGGGIVKNCTIIENMATNWGGEIFCNNGGVVQNCNITWNAAAGGGGIAMCLVLRATSMSICYR